MSNGTERLENEIEKLADHLQSLCIEQSRIASKLKRLRGELAKERRSSIGSRTKGSPSSSSTDQSYYNFGHLRFRDISGIEYDNDIIPTIEDVVRIINPNQGQAEVGRVIGFCKDGKLKLDTYQGKPVIRAKKNVMHIYRP